MLGSYSMHAVHTILSVILAGSFAVFSSADLSLGQSSSGSNVLNQLEESAGDGAKKPSKDIHPKDVIHWTALGAESDTAAGTVTVLAGLTTEQQFTIYEDKLEWLPPAGWAISKVVPPKTSMQFDPISNKDVSVYTGGEFKVTLSGPAGANLGSQFDMAVKYVGCTRVICLFPWKQDLNFPLSAKSADKGPSISSASEQPTASTSDAGGASGNTGSLEEQFARQVKSGSMTLGMMLLIAFLGGLLTNLTPCVAPMIPITIRLLSNQTGKPIVGSSMYALGIVVTYTVLGVFAAMSGALFGNLIANPIVSISFGVVMALLGLSMLGFGDLSKIQQIGGRIGSGKGGPMNAFLMGTGAGLVASPCTGPILAALLTYTAGRSSVAEATALLGVYSSGFALPYIFLGASAAKISKIKVNFTLQIATKLFFAAVMFGLSLYFLRLPLYSLFTKVQNFWGFIGVFGCVSGVALSIWFIANAKHHHNKFIMLVPSLLLGAGIFFGIQSLSHSAASAHDSLVWHRTEAEAFAASEASGKPILVDSWAEWCEACKKMDATTFADANVLKELADHWTMYKMDLTEPTDDNNKLQEKYELPGLPTITLLPKGGAMTGGQKALNGYVSAESLLPELKKYRGATE